jgi:hypothetical protein
MGFSHIERAAKGRMMKKRRDKRMFVADKGG